MKPKGKSSEKPPETIVENWRPAGGEKLGKKGGRKKLTPTLAVARLSTWRLETFTTHLRALIEQHGQIEEVMTEELVHGGESTTDVFVRFRSELVAEAVKGKINGELLDGRKLQVDFATISKVKSQKHNAEK